MPSFKLSRFSEILCFRIGGLKWMKFKKELKNCFFFTIEIFSVWYKVKCKTKFQKNRINLFFCRTYVTQLIYTASLNPATCHIISKLLLIKLNRIQINRYIVPQRLGLPWACWLLILCYKIVVSHIPLNMITLSTAILS